MKLLDWISLERLDWSRLSMNPNDGAITLLKQSPEKIDYGFLVCNTNDRAIDLLLENSEKIDWYYFSLNSNDRAVDFLFHTQKINWGIFSKNNPTFKKNVHVSNPHRGT